AMRTFKLHSGKSGAALTLRVTPRARKTEFAGVLEDGILRVRVAAPPVEGKANAELLAFLAKVLGVRKSRIDIVVGQRGLDKIVSVLDLSADEVHTRIQDWLSAQEPD
ncbi:MAG: DUF167 domain-containing protein, partial [Anaerolineales bacterium]|nr:DUF167 domain-containing protein [Anaerolineales bacterium]